MPESTAPTARQLAILEFIAGQMQERGYPPSVREIGEAVGLTSTSTVHAHLTTLQRLGLLRRDPSKPRAIEVRWDPLSGAAMQRRPATHVPLVGDVAAGTDVLAQENVEELLPLPLDFTGDGQLFMLRVRGDSMIEAGILDGDYVVARTLEGEPTKGDVVVAGIPGDEATVKTYTRKGGKVVLLPVQPPAQAHGVRAGRRRRLRQGRHRAAPPLSRQRAASGGCRSSSAAQRRVHRLDVGAGHVLVRACGRASGRRARSWWPACRARRSAPTSVQPSLARGGWPGPRHQRGQQRVVERGRGGRRQVDDRRTPSASPDHLPHMAPRPPRRVRSGAKRWFSHTRRPVGHDVAGHAALHPHRLQPLAELAPVDRDRPRLVGRHSLQHLARGGGWRCGPSRRGRCAPARR